MKLGVSRRQALVVVLLVSSFAALWLLSRLVKRADQPWELRSPAVISGDEPHYVAIVHSLLYDHDLRMTNNYANAVRGGYDTGAIFRGSHMDHHTVWVDHATCTQYRWWDVFDMNKQLESCDGEECTFFASKAPVPSGAVELPLHSTGYPMLLAALIAPTFPAPADVEPRMSLVVLIFAWLTLVVTWFAARKSGLEVPAAVFTVALVGLCSSWLVYVRVFFTEPGIGLALAIGFWAHRSRKPLLMALAVSVAVAFKPPFALFGAAWILDELLERNWRVAVKMAVYLTAGVFLFYLGFTKWLLCSWQIPTQSNVFWPIALESLKRQLWSANFGLFLFVPWTVLVLPAAAKTALQAPEHRRLLRQLLIPMGLILIVFMGRGIDPGYCYGARYWVPMMPFLAMVIAVTAQTSGRLVKALLLVAALAGAAIAVPDALTYHHDLTSWHRLPLIFR